MKKQVCGSRDGQDSEIWSAHKCQKLDVTSLSLAHKTLNTWMDESPDTHKSHHMPMWANLMLPASAFKSQCETNVYKSFTHS